MKWIKLIFIFFITFIFTYAEIKVSVYEHMKFKQINSLNTTKNIVGIGTLEILADEEDFGKVISINFYKDGYMTNKKHWIKVENLQVENNDKKFVIDRKSKKIKFYGQIDSRKLGGAAKDLSIIEGKYVGATPIILNIYSREEKDKSE